MMVNALTPISLCVLRVLCGERAVNLFTAEIAEGAEMMVNELTQSPSAVSACSAVREP